jgi:hypothetical protein
MAQPKENEWDTDSLHFMRWDWILDEMIWAFEQKVSDDAESQFLIIQPTIKTKCPSETGWLTWKIV